MSWDVSRRVFLRGAGLAAVGVGVAPSSLLVRTAHAASGAKVLVKVFLRGGADGLNLCAPYGDSEYYNLRGGIALPRPGQAGGVVNLDGYFGMHPELAPLEPFFRDGRLAFVHAVGNPELSRSHFDAQDFQESGTPGDKQTADRLARPRDRADPGTRGDAGRVVLVAARALVPRARAGAGRPDALLLRPARAQLARRGRDAADVDVPGRSHPGRDHGPRDVRGHQHPAARPHAAALERRELPERQHGQRAAAGGRADQERRRHAHGLRQRLGRASTRTRTSSTATSTTIARWDRRSRRSRPTSAACSTTWC